MDYNNDGFLDLLAGDRNGDTWLFTGGASGLASGVHLYAGGSPINTGYNCSPYLVDWDEDGYLDLLIGGYPVGGGTTSGFLHLYLNDDTNTGELNYDTYTELTFWNMYRTTHEFYDLDRDGAKDLILGNENGQVYFAHNEGTNEAPAFSTYFPLESEGSVIDVGSRARETVNDWNEDGIPDLILCNTTNDKVQIFLGYEDVGIGDEAGPGELLDLTLMLESPSAGTLSVNILSGEAGQVSISVFDCTGRIVTSEDWNLQSGSNDGIIDMTRFPSGMYIVSVKSTGGTVATGRAVILR